VTAAAAQGAAKNPTIPFSRAPRPTTSGGADGLAAAADFVLPEDAEGVLVGEVPARMGADEPLPGDDRDLLEIHDDVTVAEGIPAAAMAQSKPRRREYRRLFATLRGR
jgi:hypothetical protein